MEAFVHKRDTSVSPSAIDGCIRFQLDLAPQFAASQIHSKTSQHFWTVFVKRPFPGIQKVIPPHNSRPLKKQCFHSAFKT
jgi:hypothetical protein